MKKKKLIFTGLLLIVALILIIFFVVVFLVKPFLFQRLFPSPISVTVKTFNDAVHYTAEKNPVDFSIKVGPDHKIFLQKIKSLDGKSYFALFADSAGFGDPSWHLYRFPKNSNVEKMKIHRGEDNLKAIFWNYSEGGDQIENPKIELVHDRYIVFSRGGLYHSLYDIQDNKVLVNEESPYHGLVYSDEFEKITPRPSMKETERMLKVWKIKKLHDPIEKIIKKNYKKHSSEGVSAPQM